MDVVTYALLLKKIKGVEDRNTAETLVGTRFYVSRDVLPELDDDEFYHTDLIGLEARSSSDEVLGKVNAIYNFGAGDLIEIKMSNGHLEMLPFTAQFVPTINIKEQFIIVEMMQFAAEDDEDEGNEG